MAIPSRVVALEGDMATVEAFGQQRQVSLMLLQETIAIGDYLLVQAGGFACERVPPEAAHATLDLFKEIFETASDNA